MRTIPYVALSGAIAASAFPAHAQPNAPPASKAAGEATPVATDARGRSGMLPEGWFLPVGVNVGDVTHPQGAEGTVLGAEASIALFPVGHGYWSGFYADGLYDFASKRVRMSPGLEVGYLFLGVDGGPFFQFGEARVRFGFEVRPMLSLAVLHVYGRWGWLFGDVQDDKFREIGVLLKFPIQLIDTKRAGDDAPQPSRQ